jgi:pyruvate formate lyase activating enzyme
VLIAGLTPFTLTDFPGKVAAIVFTQGCNFRCPFCHNAKLLGAKTDPENFISEASIFDFLESRKGKLDGLVVTGGEPTMHNDLAEFLAKVKGMGFLTKLDTNGSRPEVVKKIIDAGLVDFIAMDLKAPLDSYKRLAGVDVLQEKLSKSIELISKSGIAHQFRTTVVNKLLSDDDLEKIKKMVPKGSPYVTNKFISKNALDPALR